MPAGPSQGEGSHPPAREGCWELGISGSSQTLTLSKVRKESLGIYVGSGLGLDFLIFKPRLLQILIPELLMLSENVCNIWVSGWSCSEV